MIHGWWIGTGFLGLKEGKYLLLVDVLLVAKNIHSSLIRIFIQKLGFHADFKITFLDLMTLTFNL